MPTDWLTTKKRGRDDAQIARDREAAVERRKNNRRRRQTTRANGEGKKKTSSGREGPGPKKKRLRQPRRTGHRRRYNDDDDGDSLQDFVVDDEDELSGDLSEVEGEDTDGDLDDENEEDDSLSEVDKAVAKRPHPNRRRRPERRARRTLMNYNEDFGIDSGDDNCGSDDDHQRHPESSSEEEDTFLGGYKKRTSRPPRPGDRKRNKKLPSENHKRRCAGSPPATGKKGARPISTASKPRANTKIGNGKDNNTVDLLSSEDSSAGEDENGRRSPPLHANYKSVFGELRGRRAENRRASFLDGSGSDSSSNEGDDRKAKASRAAAKESQKKKDVIEGIINSPPSNNGFDENGKKKPTTLFESSSSEDNDNLMVSRAPVLGNGERIGAKRRNRLSESTSAAASGGRRSGDVAECESANRALDEEETGEDKDDDDSVLAAVKRKSREELQKELHKKKRKKAVTAEGHEEETGDEDDDDSVLAAVKTKSREEFQKELHGKKRKKAAVDDDCVDCVSHESDKMTANEQDVAADANDDGDEWWETSPPARDRSAAATATSRGKKKLRKMRSKPKKTGSPSSVVICSDDDEATALAWALKESQEEAKRAAAVASRKDGGDGNGLDEVDNSQDVVDLLKDDEDGDADEEDVYVDDEDARAAGSILETANALAAKVLSTMSQWSSSCSATKMGEQKTPSASAASADTTTAMGDNAVIPMGMIVDGALALDDINESRAGSNRDHAWISQDVMKKVLPDVTLAGYQLVGVNWLALLDGMRCQVASDGTGTTTSNVNGVLADEMGLGKTVQTIAFLSWLKFCKNRKQEDLEEDKDGNDDADTDTDSGEQRKPQAISLLNSSDDDNDEEETHRISGKCASSSLRDATASGENDSCLPHLVVAPASCLDNWEREFSKFAPDMKVVKYYGSMAVRQELRLELEDQLLQPCRRQGGYGVSSIPRRQQKQQQAIVDVILCPITYFSKEKSDDRAFLRRLEYNYLVVDEAHLLKNPTGLRYKSLDRFKSLHRLLLTGTPVQNRPAELLSLLCFLMPLFSQKGAASDDNYLDSTSTRGNDGGQGMLQHFVSLEGDDEKIAYAKLKQLFAPFVLRRRKQDVLHQIMPPKTRRVELVELDPAARSLYDSILARHVRAKQSADAGDRSSREHVFTQLRKAAHHPLLLRSRHMSKEAKDHLADSFYRYGAFAGESCTKAMVAQELDGYNDFQIHLTAVHLVEENPLRGKDLQRYVLDEEDLFCSTKFRKLRQLLPELIAAGHRILIFSQWTSILDLLACLMEQMQLHSYLRMEGSTPVSERQTLMDKFNQDPSIPVFLLSTRACGLGINLTSADVCIMHDLDFNPTVDQQAEDRCHRIGQKKPVTVYRLVSENTVDQDIWHMQQRKVKMNAAIMDNNASKGDTAREKDVMLQTAVDRFLRQQSPAGQRSTTQAKEAKKQVPDEQENDEGNEIFACDVV